MENLLSLKTEWVSITFKVKMVRNLVDLESSMKQETRGRKKR